MTREQMRSRARGEAMSDDARTPCAPASVEIPSKAEREYLSAFGIAAVIVAAGPTGRPCFVGSTRDLGRAQARVAELSPGMVIVGAWWTQPGMADMVSNTVRATLARTAPGAGGVFQTSAEAAIAEVKHVGGTLLTVHDIALQRVRASVERLNAQVEEAKETGTLRFFNRAFKEYRRAAVERGEKPLIYSDALARLKRALVARLAATGRADLDTSILADVFRLGPAREPEAA